MLGRLFGRRLGEMDRGPATVVAVYDGDTCTCTRPSGKPIQVRLRGIDAPELRDHYGEAARYQLAMLIHDRRVILEPIERDRYGRVVCRVVLDGKDVSVAMLEAGHAFHFQRYDDSPEYRKAEERARRRRLGLWAMPWAEERRLDYQTGGDDGAVVAKRSAPGCVSSVIALVLVGGGAVFLVRGCVGGAPPAPVVPRGGEERPAVPPQPQAVPPPPVAADPIAEPAPPEPAPPPIEPDQEPAPPESADPVDAARWRTWTSADGRFTVRAKFVQATNGRMTLQREDGKRIVVELEKLSPDDIDFVRNQKWLRAGRTPKPE
jgi:endonuclease YncB( thermonuclease family)